MSLLDVGKGSCQKKKLKVLLRVLLVRSALKILSFIEVEKLP